MAIGLPSKKTGKYRQLRDRARALLPALCLVCRRSVRREYGMCRQCEAELPWLPGSCVCCGEELNEAVEICSRCRLAPPEFDACFAPFAYRSPVDKLIVDFKFGAEFAGGYALSRILARFAAARWADGGRPELLLPVPLHISRLRQRGFNQALEIAKTVSAENGIPLAARAVRKSKRTPPQTEMPDARRRGANIRGAFELVDWSALKGVERVAIVDDVVTTMSTATELARLLKQAGIAEVEVCCLARAVSGPGS